MNEEQKIQQLIDDYQKATIDKFRAEEAEKQAIKAIEMHVEGFRDKNFSLVGTEAVMKIRSRQSVTYPRSRGSQHPLEKIMEDHKDLESLVRISYAESGSKIAKLLDQYEQPGHGGLTQEQILLAEDLLKHRQTKPAKPNIEIAGRVDDEHQRANR